jgi:hypothetical protein
VLGAGVPGDIGANVRRFSERTTITMRLSKGLLFGLAAAGLVGCSGPASGSLSPSPSAPAQATTAPAAAPVTPADRALQASARVAAMQFSGLYSARKFAASWDLLSPAAKHQVPWATWMGVHEGCPSAGAGQAGVIKSVTVFGDAAIVTETSAGAVPGHATAEYVFNDVDGHWLYTPDDVSIYDHGSVAADVAAAKAAGFCGSWKGF